MATITTKPKKIAVKSKKIATKTKSKKIAVKPKASAMGYKNKMTKALVGLGGAAGVYLGILYATRKLRGRDEMPAFDLAGWFNFNNRLRDRENVVDNFNNKKLKELQDENRKLNGSEEIEFIETGDLTGLKTHFNKNPSRNAATLKILLLVALRNKQPKIAKFLYNKVGVLDLFTLEDIRKEKLYNTDSIEINNLADKMLKEYLRTREGPHIYVDKWTYE